MSGLSNYIQGHALRGEGLLEPELVELVRQGVLIHFSSQLEPIRCRHVDRLIEEMATLKIRRSQLLIRDKNPVVDGNIRFLRQFGDMPQKRSPLMRSTWGFCGL